MNVMTKKPMKAAKRMISLFLAAFMLISLFPSEAGAVEFPAIAGNETINIGIVSDTHISRSDSASNKTVETLLRNCLKGFYAATSNNLDAVAIAGDLTDNGYVDELQTVRSIIDSELDSNTQFTACMGNHEFYKYGWGVSVDENSGMKEEMQSDFTTNIGVSVEDDISVSGIHILSVSPDNELDSYTSRESFLREHIEAAAAEDPTNPIIIIAHKPVKYTVMSSGSAPDGSYATLAADWSDGFLEFLKQYPQIIYFSGHAHDDLSNDNMIYQQDFTSVQDGVVSAENASTGVLVSVDSNKVVTISRMNFTTGSVYEPSWTVDIPKVIESKDNFRYRDINTVKDVNLTVGTDESELYVNWYNSTFQTGKVQYSEASNLVNGVFSVYDEVTASGSGEAYGSDYYYNHALINDLEAGTEYAYRLGNENGWSDYYTFTTPDANGGLNFLFAADAQIGSNDTDADTAGWIATLNNAADKFPEAQFLLHGGDQVEVASDTAQYDGFLSPLQLTYLPIATIAGNHDFNSRLYSQHFAYSNVSEETATDVSGTYSGDYWFVRDNTLFMALNSNVQDTQAHKNFMQQAILDAQDAGYTIKWKIVMFHHSVFSTASHSTDEDIIERRESMPQVFSDLQVDLVLMGHDHTYCRTYMMDGTTPITTDGVQSSATNPDPGLVLYITGGSASGSKYYGLIGEDYDYAAVTYQNETPSISDVNITDEALTIAAYNSADMTTAADSFTINKTEASAEDTLKPYLFIPTEKDIVLGTSFDKLEGVYAIDNADGNITGNITVTGDVDTSKEGTYTITYEVTDSAGNTATATRSISIKREITSTVGLYFGIDIKSGEFQNESDGDVSYSAYNATGSYVFETDDELNQTVLCGPESGNLIINGLNLEPLDNSYTVETYVKIPSTVSSYDVFQFDGQNINLVGFPGNTYFGSGRYTGGDADVYVEENLPTDEWLHIICTAKDGEQTLYVNGVKFAANSYEGLNITSINSDELILGGTYSGRSGFIKFAYFRIYSGFVTETQVQGMYSDILGSFPADYTVVDEAIAKIPSDLSVYTDDSVSALNAAINAVDHNKTIAEQEVVDGYAEVIENAIKALSYKGGADYSAVYAAIAKIPANLSIYTKNSVNLLIAAKNAVVAGKNQSEQYVVDGYAAAIENAIYALVYKDADYAAVDIAIAKIPYDLSIFTGDSVTALNNAVGAVIRGKNITEQSTVDGYADAIENAIKALDNPNLYFGIDIVNGILENEIGSDVADSDYLITGDTGGYEFEIDDTLNQTVLCGPEKENLVINKLNLEPLNNQFAVEAYIKIPSQLSTPAAITAYDVFQFDGQNINLVGLPGATYFGAGRYSDGDADVFTDKNLPTDQWIHVLCTAKDGEQTLYVNGEEFSSDAYTGLNISSEAYDELVLGGTTSDRSGLIKFAYFRIYKNFVNDEQAQEMYEEMLGNFAAADYAAVDEAIAGIPDELSNYTDDSVAVLNNAVKAVVRGKNHSEQIIVNGYAAAIVRAADALVYKNADYTAVDAAIAKIPSDLSGYADESVAALNEALAAVVRGKDITEQTVVNEYAMAIENAINALIGVSVKTIDIPEINGIKEPVKGAAPTASIPETSEYTAIISWSPAASVFAPGTVYTATITITPKIGFTLEGIPADYFTVAGAISANSADSGVVTAIFPSTAEENDNSDDDDRSESSDITPSVGVSKAGNTTTVSVEVTGRANRSGKTSGSLGTDTANALIEGAKDAEEAGTKAVVEIRLETDVSAKSAEVKLPQGPFSNLSADTSAYLTVDTGIGTVTFDASAVDAINSAASGDITISIAKVDTSKLSNTLTAQVGNRPVYDFTVTSDSTAISNFDEGSVYISIPYIPSAGEDTNAIVVYYISDSGKLETVRGKYNPGTGMVEFTVIHFSKYAIGYNKVTFSDVSGIDWYYNPVTFIAARGITVGTTAETFSPDVTLTRGQFIVMLMRAYGIEADANPIENFSDAGSTYYTNYLATAKRLGIAKGVGDNKFAPDSEITRQDMFTLLYHALNVLDELPEVKNNITAGDFSDAVEIASYAQEAMNALIKSGVISGSDGRLNPKRTSTRAQMVQVFYNLLSL